MSEIKEKKENNILPTDIENIIENMVCLRKSNNKSSRDFIIICKINPCHNLLSS